MKFVVTGTGRSGTRWASEVLGVGHQAMFTGDGFVESDAAGDVSFWAASQNLEGWRVVLLVRDPRLVVASWLASGEFETMLGSGHWRMWQHCNRIDPAITEAGAPQTRIEQYWAAVNHHLAYKADVVLRLEETDEDLLAEAAGIVPPDDGVDPGPIRRDPVQIESGYARSVAREFGYDC